MARPKHDGRARIALRDGQRDQMVCASRSAVRFRTIGFTFWTVVLSLFLRGLSGELYVSGWVWRGVSGPCGADGGAVCCGPAWCGRAADVPDRGPGALAVGRRAGVFGPGRRAGEAARLPDRAWRDRGVCCCGRRAWRRRRWWRATDARRRRGGGQRLVGYVVAAGGRGARCAAAALRRCACGSCRSYMVPSAIVVLERSAADAERQARPPRAAGAGVALAGRG